LSSSGGHDRFFDGFAGVCANALPAAVFEAAPVRPSRNTFEAALAARGLVCLSFDISLLLSNFTVP